MQIIKLNFLFSLISILVCDLMLQKRESTLLMGRLLLGLVARRIDR